VAGNIKGRGRHWREKLSFSAEKGEGGVIRKTVGKGRERTSGRFFVPPPQKKKKKTAGGGGKMRGGTVNDIFHGKVQLASRMH